MKNNQNIKTNLPEVSAWTVAKYLLSFDPERKYFSRDHLLIINEEEGYRSKPTIGNFRLINFLKPILLLFQFSTKNTL